MILLLKRLPEETELIEELSAWEAGRAFVLL
jgi:hypothetical protein